MRTKELVSLENSSHVSEVSWAKLVPCCVNTASGTHFGKARHLVLAVFRVHPNNQAASLAFV